jgi:hypothetical protein
VFRAILSEIAIRASMSRKRAMSGASHPARSRECNPAPLRGFIMHLAHRDVFRAILSEIAI